MVKNKRQSKRTSLKDKYKMERKVKEHHRKARQEQRKNARMGIKPKAKKELGLPNLMPFKEQFLRKMLEDKEKEDEHERKRLQYLRERKRSQQEAISENSGVVDTDMEMETDEKSIVNCSKSSNLILDDLKRASQRNREFELAQEEMETESEFQSIDTTAKGKKRAYMKELRKVVDSSDVILLVLDARDPQSCRAPQAEKMVLDSVRDKRLVFVLNKIDLVPKHIVEKWLSELRKEFPTVAFRSSTQQQKSNLGRASKDSIGLGAASCNSNNASESNHYAIGDRVCVGADTLLQLLKNYSRNKDIKTSITVGVVGFPNVGKSSVINSLKRSRVVGVSPVAGFTKSLQSIQLDKKVKLIDSPGVLFQDSEKKDRLVLRNRMNPADLEDPVSIVLSILEKCNMEQLMIVYNLPRSDSPASFLAMLGSKRGRLHKGGVPDQKAAAREFLQDWNLGKIPYFVLPPKRDENRVPTALATVTSEWAKEFDLEALLAKEESELVERLPDDMGEENFAAIFENSLSV